MWSTAYENQLVSKFEHKSEWYCSCVLKILMLHSFVEEVVLKKKLNVMLTPTRSKAEWLEIMHICSILYQQRV